MGSVVVISMISDLFLSLFYALLYGFN